MRGSAGATPGRLLPGACGCAAPRDDVPGCAAWRADRGRGSEAGKTIDQADLRSAGHRLLPPLRFSLLELADEAHGGLSPWMSPSSPPRGTSHVAVIRSVASRRMRRQRRSSLSLPRLPALRGLGIPSMGGAPKKDLVAWPPLEDEDVSRCLVTHEGVGRVVLTGSPDAARHFARGSPTCLLGGSGR